MFWTAAQLAVIDARIKAAQRMDIMMGTASADSVSLVNIVDVILQGSAQGVPIKKFGQFSVFTGDRVGCIRFGSEWVVVGTFNNKLLASTWTEDTFASGTTTSTSFTTMPGWDGLPFTKARSDSAISVSIGMTAWQAGVAGSTAVVEVNATLASSSVTMAKLLFQFTNGHLTMSGNGLFAPGLLPQGAYNLDIGWRRVSGTGTPTVDTNDVIRVLLQEEATT